MVRLSLAASLLAALASQSSAHFLLNYPPTIGFDDNLESTAPCGSFTIDFTTDNLTNFYVGGSEIAVTSIHPQANWLFRATLGSNQGTSNWTQLMPIIQQTGIGNFCEPAVPVPPSWAGQQGILSVVQDAPDGILYQCAAVNFVAGTGTPNQDCANVTDLKAVFTTDPNLSSLVNGANSNATTPSTTTGTSSTTSSTSTAKSSAGGVRDTYQTTMSLLVFVGIASVAMLGGLI